MSTMTQSDLPDAAALLPRLTVSGLRFLDLANEADAVGDATAAGQLINLAYAAFDGLPGNVIPFPVVSRLGAAQRSVRGDSSPSVA